MSARIVQQSLCQQIASQLRAMIDAGELVPGQWIDEVRLAAGLGVSRTPLREALKVLVAEKILRQEPRRGCFVNELSVQDLEEIFPLMALLEGRCAFEAAFKAQPEDVRRLEPLHHRLCDFAARGDVDGYYEVNAQIHLAIQELAANRWLSGLISNLRGVLSLSRHRSLNLPGRVSQSCMEHLEIFAAIKAHDGDQAERITRLHLTHQLDALRELSIERNEVDHPAPVVLESEETGDGV